jgi:hypothetical protein
MRILDTHRAGRTLAVAVAAIVMATPLDAQQRCSPRQRDADLAGMQRWVMQYYNKPRPHQQITPPVGAARRLFMPHFLRSNEGFGVTFTPLDGLRVLGEEDFFLGVDDVLRRQSVQDWGAAAGALYDALAAGTSYRRTNIAPQLVMYLPAEGRDATDGVADPPYRLIGWGYVASPGTGMPPWVMCGISPRDFFLHQAGWHTNDGGMTLTPGDPDYWRDGVPGGVFYHQLSWSVHIWFDPRGLPFLPLVQPCPPFRIPGVALPAGAFFWPDGRTIRC